MTSPARSRRRTLAARARGSFLLEGLISIFIIALAVLGLVGLMSRSMQNVDDSKYRGEAAALAGSYIGMMWVSDRALAALQANFDSTSGGAQYTELKTYALQRLPNAGDPVVTIAAGATAQASDVTITITWQPPNQPPHQYVAFATIGANN